MAGSYYDKRSVSVQLEVAGMNPQQAEAVANAIRYSKDLAVTRPELRAALPKWALGIVAINIILTAVLIKVL